MKRIIGIITSCAIVPFALSCSGGKTAEENYVKASEGVLTRTMGKLEKCFASDESQDGGRAGPV